jgi:hypothetical protein
MLTQYLLTPANTHTHTYTQTHTHTYICLYIYPTPANTQFEAHRGARVRGEAEVVRLESCCACLRQEIKQLEDAAAAATTASTLGMQEVCKRKFVSEGA